MIQKRLEFGCIMAKKKGGFGRFLGSITGTPYDKMLKQVERLVEQFADDDDELIEQLDILVDQAGEAYEAEEIDAEEHDLIIEAIEDADPDGRSFGKVASEEDAYYDGDAPNSPELNLGKRVSLDDLMRARGDEFTGSFGRDEFDEFRDKMTEEFYAESNHAIQQGDHQAEIRTVNRVFGDDESELEESKRRIAQESGMANPLQQAPEPEAEEEDDEYDDSYSIDENGVEWFQDEDGYWWYREPDQADWQPYDEE